VSESFIPEVSQRVRVKPDGLSAWRGDAGTVLRVCTETQTAVLSLDKDKLRVGFWWGELEPLP
jgi:hypothetical protein